MVVSLNAVTGTEGVVLVKILDSWTGVAIESCVRGEEVDILGTARTTMRIVEGIFRGLEHRGRFIRKNILGVTLATLRTAAKTNAEQHRIF